MSEAAVAEAEVIPDSPEVPTEALDESASPPAQDTPAVATSEGTEAEAAAAEEVDHEAEWNNLVGTPAKEEAPEAAAKDDLPGMSYDEIEARSDQQRVLRQNARMQATAPQWVDFIERQYGMSRQEAQLLYEKFSPILREVHQDNFAHNMAIIRAGVAQHLPKESAQTYFSRSYTNQAEAIKTVYELGKRDAENTWQAKVKGKELFTRADLEKARTIGQNSRRAAAEAAGDVEGASSGTRARGAAPTTRSDDALLLDPKTPIQTVEKILARRNGQ